MTEIMYNFCRILGNSTWRKTMRVSDKITIRRGRAYEIKAVAADGTMLLRPTVTVALKLESVSSQPAQVVPVIIDESQEITILLRLPTSGSRQSSSGAIGLRKAVDARHGRSDTN